jgi:dihydroanticapsin dehydrogenase
VGTHPTGIDLDVRDQASIDAAIAATVERFGRIDILSNNAGVDEPSEPAVAEMSDEVWDSTMQVNVTGVFKVCRAAIPVMSDGGSIVNMASRDALIARRNAAAYCASKAALLQLTRSIALELADRRIRANCVCPGVVDTPLVDLFTDRAQDPAALRAEYARSNAFGRMADVQEISSCVLFLASDESSFVTGTAIVADGGALSW